MPLRTAIKILVVAATVLLALDLMPSGSRAESVGATTPQGRRAFVTSVITPVGQDRFSVVPIGASAATITAPMTNVDSNLREVLWDETSPDVVDGGACATWQSASTPLLQQGIALRASSSPRGTRAILVTKNVFLGAPWVFNINVWDTGTTGLSVLENVDLHQVFKPVADMTPLPWRMCARVRGDTVEFKVWPVDRPEPMWGDPQFGGSGQLPPGWLVPGKSGWYIGHLPAGAFATYRDMATFLL